MPSVQNKWFERRLSNLSVEIWNLVHCLQDRDASYEEKLLVQLVQSAHTNPVLTLVGPENLRSRLFISIQ